MADTSNAQIGSKATLAWWDTALSPDAWHLIPNITVMGAIGAQKPEVVCTDLDSNQVDRIPGLNDGDEFTFTCVQNTVTMPIIEGFFNASPPVNVDFRVQRPSPLGTSRYFTVAPLGIAEGETTPDGLQTMMFRGRITRNSSATPSH